MDFQTKAALVALAPDRMKKSSKAAPMVTT
jgi:hypothetical protein